MKSRLTRAIALAMVVAATACGDDSTGVTVSVASAAGTYVASSAQSTSRFQLVQNGTSTNLLTSGSTITLTLKSDGTLTGHITVPATGEEALNTDLTGTWTLDDNEVTIHTNEDTFLETFTFTANNSTLVGTSATTDATVNMTLVRSTT